ncbi:unnamed protein product, partial [Clonostachys byssicola]
MGPFGRDKEADGRALYVEKDALPFSWECPWWRSVLWSILSCGCSFLTRDAPGAGVEDHKSSQSLARVI